jgi:hypothetical protein
MENGRGRGWESFILERHLRVLLVEDDDSTRHVVGALLWNCNYEGRYLLLVLVRCNLVCAIHIHMRADVLCWIM